MLKVASSRRANSSDIVVAIAIAALGAGALLIPDTVLHLTPACLISTLMGEVCWGCGITHAALAFLHGDFAAAWAYNKLSLIVLPLLLCLYFLHLRMIWHTWPPRGPQR
jgi:hypothetical protein